MHLGLKTLEAFLAANRDAESLVLATVVATEGSTYRKPGALMLVNQNGEHAGLISGGCLEGDLVARARAVFETGEALGVRYDLKDDDELVLGLGLGCGGAVHLLLVRLEGADGFPPLDALFRALATGHSCRLGLVLESSGEAPPVGSLALQSTDGHASPTDALSGFLADTELEEDHQRTRVVRMEMSAGWAEVLCTDIQPTPRVLVCGAGPDAMPLIAQVLALGWDCTVVDHRPASVAETRLPIGAVGMCARPDRLSEKLDLATVDAAVVMTHHVEHDATYLKQLATSPPAYIGLLGPRARRDQLLESAGVIGLPVRGPVGLDIGAELPEAIALAVMAEIHAVLNGRSAVPLADD
jgi:xanthine dehydrogenase accessory factor